MASIVHTENFGFVRAVVKMSACTAASVLKASMPQSHLTSRACAIGMTVPHRAYCLRPWIDELRSAEARRRNS